jgi:hypothetical protein
VRRRTAEGARARGLSTWGVRPWQALVSSMMGQVAHHGYSGANTLTAAHSMLLHTHSPISFAWHASACQQAVSNLLRCVPLAGVQADSVKAHYRGSVPVRLEPYTWGILAS